MRKDENKITDLRYDQYCYRITINLYFSILFLIAAVIFSLFYAWGSAVASLIGSVILFIVWREKRKEYGKMKPEWF